MIKEPQLMTHCIDETTCQYSLEIPGHWEATVLGKNRESAIGTLVERTLDF
jgi:hypothetical protein